jgi:hypothetical protein
MAYISQETKAELAPAIRAVLARYGIKGSISIDNHTQLTVTLRSGALDLIGEANRFNLEYALRRDQPFHPVKGYYQANVYRPDDYALNSVGEFFRELSAAMRGDRWYDRSDIQTDYFDTAYYLQINVGRWDRHYVCTARGAAEENHTGA